MPELQAIVFDLDDTLYSERDYVLSGFRAVATWAEQHLSIPAEEGFTELRWLFEDGVRGDTFNRWLESREVKPDGWTAQMVQVYREHDPQIAPYPEVPDLLGRLRQRYRLGLVSDGYLQVQTRKLVSLGLASCFDAIVFPDELGHEAWKPSSRPFEMILERLGVTGPGAVYVADNPAKDFLGARQVGMWTVRIRHPGGLYSHLQPPSAEHTPDVEIGTLKTLEPILKRIGEHT